MGTQEIIKLIFSFKVKYLRLKNELSLKELSNNTGLSVSYLHDIEKAKKYPKVEKIENLAKALGVDYDYLVSIHQIDKKIKPIADLLQSDFFQHFPLDRFGIDLYKIIEILSNEPEKVNAFISTMMKLARNYHVRPSMFYLNALRSYQDMQNNYFEDLEINVNDFRKEVGLKATDSLSIENWENLLLDYFQVSINRDGLSEHKKLNNIRSYYAQNSKILFLNKGLTKAQEIFLICRELGLQFLKTDFRPTVMPIQDLNSFEKLLANFKASYFAAALLIPEQEIIKDIRQLSQLADWDKQILLKFLKKYNVSPETLLQRMTNILPHHFGINDLFFIRLLGHESLKYFRMTKELHLSQIHNPYASVADEHYCRKWVSINSIKKLRSSIDETELLADAQISQYYDTDNEYLCLSIARPDTQNPKESVSVTIGLMVNDELRKLIRFLNDPDLKKRTVNTTCERCAMPDCEARVVAPSQIQDEKSNKQLLLLLETLDHK